MTAFKTLHTALLDRLTSNSAVEKWPAGVPEDVADRRKGLDRRMRNAAGLDIAEVLVLDARQVMLNSAKTTVLHMRFAYDREFSAMIKEMVPGAVYSQATNGWKVPCDAMSDDAMNDFADLLCSRFGTIMIHDPRTVLKPRDPATGTAPRPFVPPVEDVGFAALPFDVLVKRGHVVDALAETGQTDVNAIHYDDGRNLVAWDEEVMHTRMPFLLIRFSTGTRPRYAEYSTLSGMIVSTRYHGEKNTSAMIARNRHAVLATGLPVVTQRHDVIQETWLLRMQARRIDPVFDAACVALHAEGIIPAMVGLVNPEHLTVTRRTDGAAAHHHGISAYVELHSKEHVRRVMRRLAPQTASDAEAIVVTPQFLEGRTDGDDPGFLRLLAHEAAHVVENENAQQLGRTPSGHGPGWRIHDAIMAASMGVKEEPSPTLSDYADEHGLNVNVSEVIEHVLMDVPSVYDTDGWTYDQTHRIVSRRIGETIGIVDYGESDERRLGNGIRLVDECDVIDRTFRVRLDRASSDRLELGGIIMAGLRPDCPCAGLAAGMYMNGGRNNHAVLAISTDDTGAIHFAALTKSDEVVWSRTNGRIDGSRLDFSKKVVVDASGRTPWSLPLVDAVLIEQAAAAAMDIEGMKEDVLEVRDRLSRIRRIQIDVVQEYVDRVGRLIHIVHGDLKSALEKPWPTSTH